MEKILKTSDIFQHIYSLTNTITPLPYDCGTHCNSICCRYNLFPQNNDLELCILPGEDIIHDKNDSWLNWKINNNNNNIFPSSWGKQYYTVLCKGPEVCKRSKRPFQCRSYPLEPYFVYKNRLSLIYCDYYTPYTCPIIQQRIPLSDNFVSTIYRAWHILIEDKRIKDYVLMASKSRKPWWKRPEIIYCP